jgi:protein-L-isoaspartate(D-aspartate) O-methyltransferase
MPNSPSGPVSALAGAGCDNVEVRVGDGLAEAPDLAPFDGIVVTAMADTQPPPALLEQLAPGAALVCPVGHGSDRVLVRYRDGRAEQLADVAFVPLVSGAP